MFLFLLLQHIEKPSAVAISDGGSNAALIQAVIMSLATGIAGFLVHSFIKRPAEKIEQYEAAEMKALRDNLNEFKETHRREKSEWHTWREGATEQITTLKLEQKNQNVFLQELKADVSKTKDNTQSIRESIAKMQAQFEQTIKKWSS